MEEEFDFEEAARLCDKNVTMMLYDEALIRRNFTIKLRRLLRKNLTGEEFKLAVDRLNESLKSQEKEFHQKHLRLFY